MSRKKLKRFEENANRRNVVEEGKEIYTQIKGHWREYFGNTNKLILELGCGRGEYTTGLAAHFPNINYVGVDIKGARIWKGSKVADENGLINAAFLRIRMFQLPEFFELGEVDEMWMTFPDPRMKDKDEKHRMTNKEYLLKYKALMKKGGIFHLKTDCRPLYDYTMEVIQDPELGITNIVHTDDLYHDPELLSQHYGIQTTYERKFLGQGYKINYIKITF